MTIQSSSGTVYCMMRLLKLGLALGLMLTALSGCGGGGGSAGPSTANYTFSVNFASGSNQSIVVQLLDTLGQSAGQLTLNQTSGTSLNFPQVPVGDYQVIATLYPQTNGGGTAAGTLKRWVRLTSDQTQTAAVGNTLTSIGVSVISDPVPTGETRQSFGYGIDNTGAATFTDSTLYSYQGLGGVGTVTPDGIFLATSAGGGSIRATYAATGYVGGSPISVTTNTFTRSKWTVLVYLNAANDLDTFSSLNYKQMLKVSDNSDVRFVLQWKQSLIPFVSPNPSFQGTRRILLTPQKTPHLVQDLGQTIDMGDKQTLSNFLTWGMQNYPSDRVCLVIWNHGNGWSRAANQLVQTRGVSYDSATGNHIDTWDLSTALGTKKLDILAFDASLMQMGEVLYEIRNNVSYVAGSEESPPAAGYPYDLVFKPMHDNPDGSTPSLAKGFVDGMVAQYGTDTTANLTQSVVDTSQLSAVKDALTGLAGALNAGSATNSAGVINARNTARKYEPEITGRYYFDLDQICNNLKTNLPSDANLQNACNNVKAKIAAAVLFNGNNSNSPNSTGLAIDFSPKQHFATYASDYNKLKLAQDST